MTHEMRLAPEPFEKIASGYKTIELRLNDEKRQTVNVGDTIIFRNNGDPEQTLKTEVLALHRFSAFAELYDALPLDRCGYLPHQLETASPSDMDEYYSPERQKQYGVLGIEVKVI